LTILDILNVFSYHHEMVKNQWRTPWDGQKGAILGNGPAGGVAASLSAKSLLLLFGPSFFSFWAAP